MKTRLSQIVTPNIAIHTSVSAIIILIIYSFLSQTRREIIPISIIILTLNFTIFYFHALVLVPILLKKRKTRKYEIIALCCFLLFGYLFIWLSAIQSSISYNLEYNESTTPQGFFIFRNYGEEFFNIALVYAFSFIYGFSISDRAFKRDFIDLLISSKKSEFKINVILLILFFIWFCYGLNRKQMPSGSAMFVLSAITFYLHLFYLTPLILKQKRTGLYILLTSTIVIAYYFFILLIIRNLSGPEYSDAEPFNLLKEFYIPIGGAIAIILMLSFIYNIIRIRIMENEGIITKKLFRKDAELKLLKSQVNPHFLFNSLNIIYAAAIEEKAEKTADYTTKLAYLVRYMLEDINKDYIPLAKEVKYIQDYISIQLSRCSAEQNIEVEVGNIEDIQISPGIFIPFIENAFKFGINPTKTSSLFTKIDCKENIIYFECRNSYNESFKEYNKEQGLGIGIKNVRQRLELVYPKQHTLTIEKGDKFFSVEISIQKS